LLVVLAPGVPGGAFLFAGAPLPQPQCYHNFADQRTFVGIPHCLNVVSNLPFLLVGAAGLHFVFREDVVGPGRPFLNIRRAMALRVAVPGWQTRHPASPPVTLKTP
jgi:hypothetical protein